MKIMEAQFTNWGLVKWKVLTWAEFKKFEELTNFKGPMAVSNDIYRACIIKGPSVSEATAGLVEFIVKAVYSSNAFSGDYNALNSKLNKQRKQLEDNYLLSARAIIAGIFNYTFEQIDTWDEETFLLRLAQAELVAGKPLALVKNEPDNAPIPIDSKPSQRPRQALTNAQQMVVDRKRGN